MTEMALQGMLHGESIAGGHTTITRMRAFNQDPGLGCVISGPDAAVPSYADFPTAGKGLSPSVPAGQGERAILPNEPVIIDLMWAQDGYLVDMARTYSVGPMPAKMEDAYNHAVAVLRAIEAGIRIVQPLMAATRPSASPAATVTPQPCAATSRAMP